MAKKRDDSQNPFADWPDDEESAIPAQPPASGSEDSMVDLGSGEDLLAEFGEISVIDSARLVEQPAAPVPADEEEVDLFEDEATIAPADGEEDIFVGDLESGIDLTDAVEVDEPIVTGSEAVIDLSEDALLDEVAEVDEVIGEGEDAIDLGPDAVIADELPPEDAHEESSIDLLSEDVLESVGPIGGESGIDLDAVVIDDTVSKRVPLPAGSESGIDLLEENLIYEEAVNLPSGGSSRDLIAEGLESGVDLLNQRQPETHESEDALDDFLASIGPDDMSSSVDLGSMHSMPVLDVEAEAKRRGQPLEAQDDGTDVVDFMDDPLPPPKPKSKQSARPKIEEPVQEEVVEDLDALLGAEEEGIDLDEIEPVEQVDLPELEMQPDLPGGSDFFEAVGDMPTDKTDEEGAIDLDELEQEAWKDEPSGEPMELIEEPVVQPKKPSKQNRRPMAETVQDTPEDMPWPEGQTPTKSKSKETKRPTPDIAPGQEKQPPTKTKPDGGKPPRGRMVLGIVLGGFVMAVACVGLWAFGIEPPSDLRDVVGTKTTQRPGTGPTGVTDSKTREPVGVDLLPPDTKPGQAVAHLVREGHLDKVKPEHLSSVNEENPAELVSRAEFRWRKHLQEKASADPAEQPSAEDESVKQALQDLEKAIALKHAEAYLLRGNIRKRLKDWDAAKKDLETGRDEAASDPDKRRRFENALRALRAARSADEADKTDEKKAALQLPAEAQDALLALLLVNLFQPKDLPEAGEAFNEALELYKDGKLPEARRKLEEAEKRHRARKDSRFGKAQNPDSDPDEDIFLRACEQIKRGWDLQERLSPALLGLAKDADVKTPQALAASIKSALVTAKDQAMKAEERLATKSKEADLLAKDLMDRTKELTTKGKELDSLGKMLKDAGTELVKARADLKGKDDDLKVKDLALKARDADLKKKDGDLVAAMAREKQTKEELDAAGSVIQEIGTTVKEKFVDLKTSGKTIAQTVARVKGIADKKDPKGELQEALKTIAVARADRDQAISTATKEVATARELAKKEVTAAQAKAETEIADARAKATKQIDTIKTDADKEIRTVKADSAKAVKDANDRAAVGIFAAQTAADKKIAQIQADTTRSLTDMQGRLARRPTAEQLLPFWLALLEKDRWSGLENEALKQVQTVQAEAKLPPETRAKAELIQGLALRNLGQYADAVPVLRKAKDDLADVPGEWPVSATQALREAVDPAGFIARRAEELAQRGKVAEAMTELERGLKVVQEKKAALYAQRGRIAFDESRLGKKNANTLLAKASADAALAAGDGLAAGLYLMGEINEHQGDLANAEKNYREAIAGEKDLSQSSRYKAALGRVLMRRMSGPGARPVPPMIRIGQAPVKDKLSLDLLALTLVTLQPVPGLPEEKVPVSEAEKLADEILDLGDKAPFDAKAKALAIKGLHSQALKTYVKGLMDNRLLAPGPGNELLELIKQNPRLRMIDSRRTPDPLEGERRYAAGMRFFTAKNYPLAEREFSAACEYDNGDARYFYFLGLSMLARGNRNANEYFDEAARLERLGRPDRAAVSAALERVQGPMRRVLNSYRNRPVD